MFQFLGLSLFTILQDSGEERIKSLPDKPVKWKFTSAGIFTPSTDRLFGEHKNKTVHISTWRTADSDSYQHLIQVREQN